MSRSRSAGNSSEVLQRSGPMSEKGWHLHPSRAVQDQDAGEASDQSWKKDDVRKGGCGEGEAGEDGRQGFRGRGLEAEHLRCCPRSVQADRSPWGCPRSGPILDKLRSCAL